MKNLETKQMENLAGGLCTAGPGQSDIGCTGICLAGLLSYIQSDGHSHLGIILC